MISRQLKSDSDARGAFAGSRPWMNAFSFSESHFACSGTAACQLIITEESKATYNPAR